jgi:hypothetical protein
MLVSVSSFLPIIAVGPISDLIGTTAVMVVLGASILIAGIGSVMLRGPLRASEHEAVADPHAVDPIAAALGADRPSWSETRDPRRSSEVGGRESPSAFGGDAPDRD